jgi:hypothetical protein
MAATRRQIRAELLALKSDDGLIYPERVHGWAQRHPNSALYNSLNWDDATAAHEHRLWQIRQLIQVHITIVSGTREFVSLTIDRASGGGYREVADVVASGNLRQIMLDDALEDLERVRRKYQLLDELAGVWKAAEAARPTPRRKRAQPARKKSSPRRRRPLPGGGDDGQPSAPA